MKLGVVTKPPWWPPLGDAWSQCRMIPECNHIRPHLWTTPPWAVGAPGLAVLGGRRGRALSLTSCATMGRSGWKSESVTRAIHTRLLGRLHESRAIMEYITSFMMWVSQRTEKPQPRKPCWKPLEGLMLDPGVRTGNLAHPLPSESPFPRVKHAGYFSWLFPFLALPTCLPSLPLSQPTFNRLSNWNSLQASFSLLLGAFSFLLGPQLNSSTPPPPTSEMVFQPHWDTSARGIGGRPAQGSRHGSGCSWWRPNATPDTQAKPNASEIDPRCLLHFSCLSGSLSSFAEMSTLH